MLTIELELDETYCLIKNKNHFCPLLFASDDVCCWFKGEGGYGNELIYDNYKQDFFRCPKCLALEKEQEK